MVEQRYGDGSDEQPEIGVEVVAVERNIPLVEIADTVNTTETVRSAAQEAQAAQTLHAGDTSADTSMAISVLDESDLPTTVADLSIMDTTIFACVDMSLVE